MPWKETCVMDEGVRSRRADGHRADCGEGHGRRDDEGFGAVSAAQVDRAAVIQTRSMLMRFGSEPSSQFFRKVHCETRIRRSKKRHLEQQGFCNGDCKVFG